MSFKLLPASIEGGRSLAPTPVTHHPTTSTHGKHYEINSVLKLDGLIGNSPVQFLLDSGAALSVVRYGALGGYYHQLIMEANTPVAVAANGAAMEVIGQVILPVNMSGFQFNQLFTVVHSLTVDCILGADCLLQHQAIIDCKQHCVTMSGVKLPFLVQQVCTNNSEINLVSNAVKVFETVVIAGRTIHPLLQKLQPWVCLRC